VSHLGPVLVAVVLSLVSPATREIEGIFLRGEAAGFEKLTSSDACLIVSFSGPVGFSDLLTGEQTVLWFRKLFRQFRTIGFYPEAPVFEGGAFVFKARWEVEAPDRRQQAYDIFFLIRRRPSAAGPPGRRAGFWSLLQIRAERR